MMTIIIKSLVTFFAIYGFVKLIKEIINCFLLPIDDSSNFVIVIKVKNSENSIESTVRTVIWKALRASCGGRIPDILIVDLGSTDQTSEIAKKLSDDYSFIYYTTEDLYIKAKGE